MRVVLWTFTALFLVASGYLALNACGAAFPSLNYCAPKPVSTAQALHRENRQLLSLRDDALERLNRASQCAIPREEAALPQDLTEDLPEDATEETPQEAPEETVEDETAEELSTCQPPLAEDVLVLVDGSASMGSDYELDPTLSREMDNLYQQLDDADLLQLLKIRQDIAEIEAQSDDPSKANRIDVAKDALRPLLGDLPASTRLRLMSFAACGLGAQDKGSFTPQDDAAYRDAVDGLALQPSSALAEALAQLPEHTEAGRTPDRPVNIILLSDGIETCRGDPCAAAAQLKADLPHANVSVLSLSPLAGSNACIAEKTGGQLYETNDVERLQRALRQSVGSLSEGECRRVAEEEAEN